MNYLESVEVLKMVENIERRKSIKSTAAKAGGLYNSEVAAERVLRRNAIRALDKVADSLAKDFLSLAEVEEKLGLKMNVGGSNGATR